jgi:ornithine decarboxylase
MVDRLSNTGPHVAGPVSVGAVMPEGAVSPDGGTYARVQEFLERHPQRTPCLVIDLNTVRERYRQMRAALPWAKVVYAVKANPARGVVRLLAQLGSNFEVASPAEIDLCIEEGAAPDALSYGNTVKKPEDIAYAYARGARLFAFDSEPDLENIARWAPGSSVFCRVLTSATTARTPSGQTFGCSMGMAVDLLAQARRLRLDPCGVCFHVGSQRLDPKKWDTGFAAAARIALELEQDDIKLTTLNIGGGLPAHCWQATPSRTAYATAVQDSLNRHFGARGRVLIELGRAIVADAGVIRADVVLVSRKSYYEERRWVYLDVGPYGRLAETEVEASAHRLVTSKDGEPIGPTVLAGPTCDGGDVRYQRTTYQLPLDLRAGDHVDLLGAGAYPANCCALACNGFEPMSAYCIPIPP